jgi:hypothetical protein
VDSKKDRSFRRLDPMLFPRIWFTCVSEMNICRIFLNVHGLFFGLRLGSDARNGPVGPHEPIAYAPDVLKPHRHAQRRNGISPESARELDFGDGSQPVSFAVDHPYDVSATDTVTKTIATLVQKKPTAVPQSVADLASKLLRLVERGKRLKVGDYRVEKLGGRA